MSRVRIDDLARTISQRLNVYSSDILQGTKEAAKVVVDEMVQTTKQRTTTKQARGKYARSISSMDGESSVTSQSRIWYVKSPRYRLAHLLDAGHKIGKTGKRYHGDQHITRATEKAEADFEARVEEVIRRAGD